jgi:hypothetical protein
VPTPTYEPHGVGAGNAAAITLLTPSHQADDILIAVLQTAAQAPGNNPPAGGWAECPGSPQSLGVAGAAGSNRLSAFWLRAPDGAVPDVAAGDSGDHQIGRILCIRGCRPTGSPFDFGTGATGTGTTAQAPGGETLTPECLILNLFTHAIDTTVGQFSGHVNPDLAALTARTNTSVGSGVGGGYHAVTGEKAAAGIFGDTEVTLAAASNWCSLTLALASVDPVVSGDGPPVPPRIYVPRQAIVRASRW